MSMTFSIYILYFDSRCLFIVALFDQLIHARYGQIRVLVQKQIISTVFGPIFTSHHTCLTFSLPPRHFFLLNFFLNLFVCPWNVRKNDG